MNPPYSHVDCVAEEPDSSGSATVFCPTANLLANDTTTVTNRRKFDLAILLRVRIVGSALFWARLIAPCRCRSSRSRQELATPIQPRLVSRNIALTSLASLLGNQVPAMRGVLHQPSCPCRVVEHPSRIRGADLSHSQNLTRAP